MQIRDFCRLGPSAVSSVWSTGMIVGSLPSPRALNTAMAASMSSQT